MLGKLVLNVMIEYNSGTFKEVGLGRNGLRREREKKQQEAAGLVTSHPQPPASVHWPDSIGPALRNGFTLTVPR